MKAFIFWMDEEAKTNTEFRLVFKQPGFESFLEERMKERIRNIDLSTTLKVEKPTKLLSFYVTFFLDELQDEIPLAIDAWIERYGIPAPEDDLIGIDPFTSRPDEWRMDDDRELGSGFSREEIDILMEDNTGTMEVHAQELEQLLHELENG
ncbi:MAG: hypothetical protein LBH96_02225 [Candidatus Peribacteria bacterium]|jgi:hypothetical protein|nr:hypothetical protein [Candidatus Peribacteria bacterium]